MLCGRRVNSSPTLRLLPGGAAQGPGPPAAALQSFTHGSSQFMSTRFVRGAMRIEPAARRKYRPLVAKPSTLKTLNTRGRRGPALPPSADAAISRSSVFPDVTVDAV